METILERVQSGNFDPISELCGTKDNFIEAKATVESITNNVSKTACIQMVSTKILPHIFNKTADNVSRDRATDIGLDFLQCVNIFNLGDKEQEEVLNSIEETYIKVIGELRDSNYANWDKLWIFLLKFCNCKIHSKMSLANKLLRVVEVAFRNSTSIEQRLKAYDCWIELINNSSLNMEYMCSPKQIKLLMTPMKAKFSRMPIVIMKRCDTFVYLLEKLGDKATMCLKEFLEFCFGPFDDKNDGKMKQGRSVADVCSKSTRVLLEILGHSHEPSETCFNNSSINLYKPLITDQNFPKFAEILINSVVQSYVLLNEWSQDVQNSTIIKCLWRSILQFFQQSSTDVKKRCCIQINNVFKKLLETSHSEKHLHMVLANMVNLTIETELVDSLKETIFDVSLEILPHFADCSSLDLENMKTFVVSCLNPETGSNFDRSACNALKNNMKSVNPIMCEVWLKCKIQASPDNLGALIWAVRHYRSFTDAEAVKSKWTKIYTSECKTDSIKAAIMKEIERLFLENPLLSSNVVVFLVLVSSGETNPSRDFVSKFMRLIELVLSLPNLANDDVNKIGSIALTYCNQSHHFYKSENNDEALDKLCGCLERLVTIHKDYRVLKELPNHLKNSQPKNLTKFSKRLMSFLEALMLNEDNSTANYARNLIELLETKENEPETTTSSSRSQRLINMANASKSKRLTGLKTSSPLSLKSTPTSTPKNKNWIFDSKKKKDPLFSQDNSSDYVKIDTEIKIDVDKLSEHQKEMFKKRREDIPALYQDLTQSQSQDLFNSVKTQPEETKENGESKKRKRSDEEDDEVSAKSRKIDEENIVFADTQTQISTTLDPDLTKILDEIPLEPIQKEPPEDLFQDTPIKRTPEITVTEEPSPKPKKPKSPEKKKLAPESPSRKSPRHSAKSPEVSNVAKELNLLLGNVLNPEEKQQNGLDSDEILSIFKDTNEIRMENGDDHEPEPKEVTTRKSQRRVKKRNTDFMLTVTTKPPAGNVRARRLSLPLAKDDSKKQTKELNQKRAEADFTSKKMANLKARRSLPLPANESKKQASSKNVESKGFSKQNKKKEKRSRRDSDNKRRDSADSNESISELLARVDKRIEENKKLELSKSEIIENEIAPKEDQSELVSSKEEAEEPKTHESQTDNKEEVEEQKTQTDTTTSKPVPPPVDSDNKEATPVNEAVFEFKATETSRKSEPRRRRNKSLPFSRSDYRRKRTKKPSKDSPEKSCSFHITADSIVPLSKSSSLRAVPSPDTGETITILITRSPPESSKQKPEETEVVRTTVPKSSTPIPSQRRSKRRHSFTSEDLIESSQEPTVLELTRRKSKDKPHSLKQTTIDDLMKPLPPPEGRRLAEKINAELCSEKENNLTHPRKPRRLSLNEPQQKINLGKRAKRSKSLDKDNFSKEPVVFSPKNEENHVNDKPASPLPPSETTPPESENLPDTLTLSPVSPVSSPTKDNLPGSPITCDTPDRTTELLNSTSDISPINSQDNAATPKPTNEIPNMRVARLLQMVNSNVQVSKEGRTWFGKKNLTSSPRSSKVRKMRMRKEEDLDILTFSREVPSPLIVPSSGILKRKLNHVDEVVSAPFPKVSSRKRKRVNFSDPAISEKKIFIIDSEEYHDSHKYNLETLEEKFNNLDKQKPEEWLSNFDREEALDNFKELCESSLKDDSDLKNVLLDLKEKLDAPELEDVITKCLDSQQVDEVPDTLLESSVDAYLPKLLDLMKKLSDDQLQLFIDEITAIIKRSQKSDQSEEEVEKYVDKLDCDKMNDLVKTYFSKLQLAERNDFLVKLMSLASSELPVTKEFINYHLNLVQNFVGRMSE